MSVVCTLFYLYLRSGCQASVVASALAFHPPPPTYEFQYNEKENKYHCKFLIDIGFARYLNYNLDELLTVDILTTKTKTKIPVFFYRNPEASQTILFSHGNASDCGIMSTLFMLMAKRLKVNILAYDYTGYGVSLEFGIRPTEKQTYKDIERVYQWAIENQWIKNPGKELIIYGQSVGSGPSCYFAAKYEVAGLILHSPIQSGLRVITDSRLLACFDIFPNIDRIRNVRCPVFVIHGEDDVEVPAEHGRLLHEAVQENYRYTPWWVKQRGHNDVLLDNEEVFLKKVGEYLSHLKKSEGK